MIASIIFSPFVGYGFFLCSYSQAFSVLVVSRVAFFLRAPAAARSIGENLHAEKQSLFDEHVKFLVLYKDVHFTIYLKSLEDVLAKMKPRNSRDRFSVQ